MFHDNQAQKYVLLSSGDQRDVDDESGDSSLKKIDYLPATEEHTCFIEPNALTGRSLLTCLQTLIIFCATVLFFAALLILLHYRAETLASWDICQTEICRRAADELRQAIGSNSSNINPCVNFPHYTCEGWNTRHHLREDQGNIFTGTIIQDQSDALMRQILEDYSLPFEASSQEGINKKNLRKVQQSYAACMNEQAIEEEGIEPLSQLIHELHSYFEPVGHDVALPRHHISQDLNSVAPNQLTKALSFLYKLQIHAMFRIDVVAEPHNYYSKIPFFSTALHDDWPSISHYQNESFVNRYASVIAAVIDQIPFRLVELGSEISHSHTNLELAHSIVSFEAALAKRISNLDHVVNHSTASLSEVQAMLPKINVRDLISDMNFSNIPDSIMVVSESYLSFVSELISKTEGWIVQSYLAWKLVQKYYSFIQSESVKPLHDFSRRLAGQDPNYEQERWRICVHHVIDSLDGILSSFYIEKAFPDSKKKYADKIVISIKNAFRHNLRNAEWMSEQTRNRSLKKLDLLVAKIGYPSHNPDLRNPSSVYDYYKTLSISLNSYFANVVSTSHFKVKQAWLTVGTSQRISDRWDRTATSFNAYYSRDHNEIVIPAGFMQEPAFYSHEVPSYLTYGAFGAIVGHEISHAFDSTGRLYDSSGARTNWWDMESAAEFDNRTLCFIKQYDEFLIPGENANSFTPFSVDGRMTLDENLADYSGLHAAFTAYKEHESLHPSKLLPGLTDYSREQLFFLAYGRYWCEKNRREILLWRLQNDAHAPNFARVLGAVANEPEFGEVWKCGSERQSDNTESQWLPRCFLW